MNKKIFIDELRKYLIANDIEDVAEITAEYEDHFMRKAADGYSEDEISAKLGNPKDIAGEYESASRPAQDGKGGFGKALALCAKIILAAPLCIIGAAWAVCLLVGAVSFAFIGACLIFAPAFEENTLIIPYMPYISGAILGVSIIAIGVLLVIFSIYVFALIKKTTAAFAKRQKRLDAGRKPLPYTIFPLFEGRARRAVRRVTLAALAVFAVCFTAAFLLMTVQSGSFEFWHVWGWFNYIG